MARGQLTFPSLAGQFDKLRLPLMSFFLSQKQLLEGSKDVTRRLGWLSLKAGQRIKAVYKAQGLKKGSSPEVLGIIEVISVRRERLDEITQEDCVREGFPQYTPAQFVEMFCKHMRCTPDTVVTRIEFKLVVVR